jgi:hypothetical protein
MRSSNIRLAVDIKLSERSTPITKSHFRDISKENLPVAQPASRAVPAAGEICPAHSE